MVKGHGKKRQFSRSGLRHGMFVDSTLFASSDEKRRIEFKQERRSRRAAELQSQFDEEARRLMTLERVLDQRQTRRTRKLTGYLGASILQRQWRLYSAQRELVRLRDFFAGRLIVDFAAYKIRASVARRAAGRIQRSMLAIARKSAAKRYYQVTIASIKIQLSWRQFLARRLVLMRLSISAVAKEVALASTVYGFTRAHLCILGPQLAARMIQLQYRRRIRRRRAAERRYKRPIFNTRRHPLLKKIADAARVLVFQMPTHDAVRGFVYKVRSLNPDSVTQIAKTRKFLADTEAPDVATSVRDEECDRESFEDDRESCQETFVTQPRPPSSCSERRRRPPPSGRRQLVDRRSREEFTSRS